jgi:HEAT repeat protein
MQDPESKVRTLAAEALGNLPGPRTVEALIKRLKDADAPLRISIVKALTETRDERAIEPLIALLKDSDAALRRSAFKALRDTHDVRATDVLIQSLNDRDARMRNDAAASLRGIGMRDSRAVEPLFALVKNADTVARGNAALALGSSRDSRVPGLLLPLLNKPVRYEATTGLALNS